MWQTLTQVWYAKEVRKNIFFVLALLVVFRLAAHIPLPGVDVAELRRLFSSNQILGLLNLLSGGGISNFSVMALGVGPYITASIIFQLLTMLIPSLEELSKDGEYGQQKINQYTRVLTVPLAIFQSYGLITLLSRSSRPIFGAITPMQLILTVVTMTAGCMFLMWIGEIISERKIGNGISTIIFVGIVVGLPKTLQQTIATFDMTQIFNLGVLIVLGLLTIAGIVIITQAQRNIAVTYARQMRGTHMVGGTNTYLPIRVNQAGMIPIIFAISMILFPPLLAQFFLHAKSAMLVSAAQWVINVFQNQLFYGILYFVLVFLFTYFYTSIIFRPNQISENLQKQGGFIPGIRPGQPTAQYLQQVSNRIMLAGAAALGVIAVLPLVTQEWLGIQTLVIGGAGLLIVVGVVIEIANQIQAQLVMREYEV